MKKIIIKLFSLFITLVLMSLFLSPKSHAVAPNLHGYVLTKTGTPIAGVWVKWVENNGDESNPENGVRYAQTDANGRFTYVAWQTLLFKPKPTDPNYNIEYKTFIDTNLDGINDTRMNNINIPADPWEVYHHYGCGQNTHEFTVIQPVGWTGTFNDGQPLRVSFQNVGSDKDLGVIEYDNTIAPITPCGGAELNSVFNNNTVRITNTSSRSCNWNAVAYAMESFPRQYGPVAQAGERLLQAGDSYTWNFSPYMNGYDYDNMLICALQIDSYSGETGYKAPVVDGDTPRFEGRIIGGEEFGFAYRYYQSAPTCVIDGGTASYKISGNVFLDKNKNSNKDSGEPNYQGARIALSGAKNAITTTDSSGSYSFINLAPGTYTVTITPPVGYEMTTVTTQTFTLAPNQNMNFGIHRFFSIAGYVFNDTTKNNFRDPNEPYYDGGITITSTGGTLYIDGNTGTFDINELNAGTYTIAYTSLPGNYRVVYPQNGPPPSYTVTVGPSCMVDATTGATCTIQGDITKLGFAITDSIPWIQSVGAGILMDNGYVNYIPAAPVCSGSYGLLGAVGNNPGIISSGDVDPYFGYGSSSPTQWVVGGTAYPSLYKPTNGIVPTSYTQLLANLQKNGVTITNIQSINGCNNLSSCSLPNSLNGANAPRIFRANGDVTLDGFSFPNNRDYIFLINGTLRLIGNSDVPQGSTVIFSASEDIIIDRAIGEYPTCTPSSNRGIEGIFSADKDIIIEGTPNCVSGADSMLKIEGLLIVNASRTGGEFINNRDLCGNNKSYPSVQLLSRPDFILNVPDILKKKSFIYQEVAP